jgi:DNA topoisomerase VI subunit A
MSPRDSSFERWPVSDNRSFTSTFLPLQIRDQLHIPVLALVDSDPYGLKILSVYCSGSKGMSYDSNHLTTSDIKWIGVDHLLLLLLHTVRQIRPSDLDKYNLPAQCRLPLTDHDRKMGMELLKVSLHCALPSSLVQEAFIQKNPKWVEELELMLRTGEKAEIQVYPASYLPLTCLSGLELFWLPIHHPRVPPEKAPRGGLDLTTHCR